MGGCCAQSISDASDGDSEVNMDVSQRRRGKYGASIYDFCFVLLVCTYYPWAIFQYIGKTLLQPTRK